MELRGNLRDFGLPDIIQLVSFGRKTGALRVESSIGGATLYFDQGQVIHAEYPGFEGEEAAYLLFRIPAGDFRFQAGVQAPLRTIEMDPTNLVMEAVRRLDEACRDGGCEEEENLDFEGDFTEGWLSEPEAVRNPARIKSRIQELLQRHFGKNAKKLLQAVEQCGDSEDELVSLAERLEKYIHVFLDNRASRSVGDEIRSLIFGPPA